MHPCVHPWTPPSLQSLIEYFGVLFHRVAMESKLIKNRLNMWAAGFEGISREPQVMTLSVWHQRVRSSVSVCSISSVGQGAHLSRWAVAHRSPRPHQYCGSRSVGRVWGKLTGCLMLRSHIVTWGYWCPFLSGKLQSCREPGMEGAPSRRSTAHCNGPVGTCPIAIPPKYQIFTNFTKITTWEFTMRNIFNLT